MKWKLFSLPFQATIVLLMHFTCNFHLATVTLCQRKIFPQQLRQVFTGSDFFANSNLKIYSLAWPEDLHNTTLGNWDNWICWFVDKSVMWMCDVRLSHWAVQYDENWWTWKGFVLPLGFWCIMHYWGFHILTNLRSAVCIDMLFYY